MKNKNTRIITRRYRLPSSFFPFPSSFAFPSFFPLPSSLAFTVVIGDDLKFQGGATATTSFPDLGALISQWLPNVYVVAGLLLFFYTLFGGFLYITAAGEQKKLEEGKSALTSAIVGFAILFGSYWIIQIVQVLTGVPILKPGF